MVLFHVGRSDAHTYSHSAPYYSPDEHIRESGGMGHRDFHGVQYGGDQPLSTGGALALAAYSSEAGAAAGEMDRLFVKMFGISAIGVVTLSTLAYFGFYRWLL